MDQSIASLVSLCDWDSLINTTTGATVQRIGMNGQMRVISPLAALLQADNRACRANAVVSEDGARIAVSNMTRGFDIYSLRSGAPLCSLDHEIRGGYPTPVLWLHVGLALLGGTTAGQLTLWDVMNVNEVHGADGHPVARVLYRLPLPSQATSLAIAVRASCSFMPYTLLTVTRPIMTRKPMNS